MLLRKIPNHITGYQHPPSFTKFTSVTKKKEISTRFKNNLTVTRPRDGAAPSIPFLLFLKRFFTQPVITIKVIMQILMPQWWNFEKTWTCVDQVVGMALPLFGIGAQDRNSPSGFRVWDFGDRFGLFGSGLTCELQQEEYGAPLTSSASTGTRPRTIQTKP